METFATERRPFRRALWQLTAPLLMFVLLTPAQAFASEGGRGYRIEDREYRRGGPASGRARYTPIPNRAEVLDGTASCRTKTAPSQL
jgi:hypothetical protein